jgi:hypothetical protein
MAPRSRKTPRSTRHTWTRTAAKAGVTALAVPLLIATLTAPSLATTHSPVTAPFKAAPGASVSIRQVTLPNHDSRYNPQVTLTYSCTTSEPNTLAYTVKQGDSFAFGTTKISCPQQYGTVTDSTIRTEGSQFTASNRAQAHAAIGVSDPWSEGIPAGIDLENEEPPITGPESLLGKVMGTDTLDACLRNDPSVMTCPTV